MSHVTCRRCGSNLLQSVRPACGLHSTWACVWACTVCTYGSLHVVCCCSCQPVACLRRILGISRLDLVPNAELFVRAGVPCLSELLRRHRLRWLGHLARMPNERWAKQLLFAHEVPGGSRRVGRPSVVWAGLVREDLANRQVVLAGRSWCTVAQDRAAWKAVVAGVLP
jgi:hypothetical protein